MVLMLIDPPLPTNCLLPYLEVIYRTHPTRPNGLSLHGGSLHNTAFIYRLIPYALMHKGTDSGTTYTGSVIKGYPVPD
jgi:hypothetical protein